jgi:RNA polymerase sigma-70 factor (ECF subfamily)
MAPGKHTLDEMAPAVYAELRRLARHYLSDKRPNHTLQPTALVHEAYIRLVQQHSVEWQSRAHFVGIAATMMRRILLNHARARKAAKRDGQAWVLQVESAVDQAGGWQIELLDLERVMQRLKELDAQQEKVVELRFFGGLSVEETAEVLGIGSATVKRHWATARLWLTKQLQTS